MSEDPEMHVQKPTFKNELNLTTIVMAVGLFATIGGWVWTASGTTQETKSWIINHEQLHKDRLAQLTGSEARTEARLKATEDSLQTISRKQDQTEYRITVQEQGSASLSRSVEELKNTVNGQSADIRVMLEILKRFDGTTKNGK